MFDRRGSVAAISALLLPVIAGVTLFGVDHMRASQQIAAMQRAADAAALASARQLSFVLADGEKNETLTAIAAALVGITLGEDYADLSTRAELIEEDQVRVGVTARYGSLFGEMGAFGENPFTVEATARTFGGQNVCFIAMGADADDPGIEMENASQLIGGDCEIYSNSDRTDSVTVTGSARIDAPFVCSSGGYSGSASNFATLPATDCPMIEDPLVSRTAPPFDTACDHDGLTLDDGTHTLEPGTYCGKTDIRNGADVWLNEGIYIFRKGELHVHDTGKLAGKNVGLYFDDKKAFFKFMDEGEIELSAPVTGPMAGILMASRPVCGNDDDDDDDDDDTEDRCFSGRKFSITSSNVRSLIGTIHLPTDHMTVDTTMPVSGEAAFTIVVVGSLEMRQSPTLVLNTDYDATDVPVPPGFRGGDTAAAPLLVR